MKAADSVSVDGTLTATVNVLVVEGLTGLRLCVSQLLLFIR